MEKIFEYNYSLNGITVFQTETGLVVEQGQEAHDYRNGGRSFETTQIKPGGGKEFDVTPSFNSFAERTIFSVSMSTKGTPHIVELDLKPNY